MIHDNKHDSDQTEPRKLDFIRSIVAEDLKTNKWDGRVVTRFPPEPNGYLHIGHAKSICLNFGLARDYGGICHLRFDDTNPEKEEQEYVDAIKEMVSWLGWKWEVDQGGKSVSHLFYASDYFDFMYRAAEYLIEAGFAYVDEQTPEEMRAKRGDFATPGTNSPFRDRSPAQHLARFREMRDGLHPDGAMVLRAKIDMAAANINMRDPALYRIRRATHHNTGDRWCIYPMYTFAHPIEDALECITHSVCTLEFEDQRPFYDWLLSHLADGGLLARPLPHQYEFGRLNLSYVVTSKRKLRQLVDEGHVSGWDAPRMPTLVGMRRRGYTPESIRNMVEATGVTKQNAWLDYSVLDGCLRADLEGKAGRACAVLDPLKLRLTNYAEVFGSLDHREACSAPAPVASAGAGHAPIQPRPRTLDRAGRLHGSPAQGLPPPLPRQQGAPGSTGYIVECTGCEKDASGQVTAVLATLVPDTKSGTPGADAVKVKGVITWVGAHEAVAAEVRLYDRLFKEAQPDAGGKGFPGGHQPGQPEDHPGLAGALAEGRAAGHASAVRTSRLLRDGSRGSCAGTSGLQQDGQPQGQLEVMLFNRSS